jgi:hypothetical protein
MKTILRAPGRRHTIFIEETDYVIIRDFIYHTIRRHKEILIVDLIAQANGELLHKIEGDIGYYILSVKQDMESKGMIKYLPKSPLQKFPMIGLKRRKMINP